MGVRNNQSGMAAATVSHYDGGVEQHRVSVADSDQWDFSVPDPLDVRQASFRDQNMTLRWRVVRNVTPTDNFQQQPQAAKLTSQPTPKPNKYNRPFSPTQRNVSSSPAVNGQQIREADTNGINGTSSLGRSAKLSLNQDPAYLSPYKDKFERPGLDGSRSGSEPDSLLDLYKNQRHSAGRSIGEATPESKKSEPLPVEPEVEEEHHPDESESRWIHRDKLLLIEKQEMQELGITAPPAPRAHSRSKSRREQDRIQDKHVNGDEDHEHDIRSAKEGKKRRLQSPIPQEPDEEDRMSHMNEMDPRGPDEIATESQLERTTSPGYQQHRLRASSSRIPLPKSIPAPMPKDGDRSTPTHRRGTSSGDGNVPGSPLRSRNNSMNSANLLNDDELSKTPPSYSRPGSSGSPTKTRTSSLPRQVQHNRKLSNSTPNTKPRSPSTNTTPRSPSGSTPTIRPRSRQGLEPRPPTAINRPEGEPPWIKEMYKPDPMLPPDQQMLPTHAKRLQQEQWESARKDSEVRQRELGHTEAKERKIRPSEELDRAAIRDINTDKANNNNNHVGRGFPSPLAMHTRSGLLPSRDGTNDERLEREREKERARKSLEHARGMEEREKGEKRSPTGNYSPLPPLPTKQDGVGGGGGIGVGATGLRKEARAVDPFEKERVGRLREEEEKKRRGGSKGEQGGMEGGQKEKEVGCTCCVIM